MLEEPNGEVERKKLIALWKLILKGTFNGRRLVVDSAEVGLRELIRRQVGLVNEELGNARDFVWQFVRKEIESVHFLREIALNHNQFLHQLVQLFLKRRKNDKNKSWKKSSQAHFVDTLIEKC